MASAVDASKKWMNYVCDCSERKKFEGNFNNSYMKTIDTSGNYKECILARRRREDKEIKISACLKTEKYYESASGKFDMANKLKTSDCKRTFIDNESILEEKLDLQMADVLLKYKKKIMMRGIKKKLKLKSSAKKT